MTHVDTSKQLRPDSVPLPGLIAQSVGSIGPELSAVSIGAVAAAFAGASTPFAFLLGGIGGFALARIISHFATDISDAGGIYAFVKQGIGPRAAFVLGWIYLGGVVLGPPVFLILSAVLAQDFLGAVAPGQHWVSGHWIVWVAALGVAALALSYFGVRLSVRVLLALSAVGVLSVLILDLVVLSKGGAHGIVWSALLPSHLQGVSFGHFGVAVGLSLTAFAGFEGAIYLSEESVAPKRHVPIAVTGSFVGTLAFYLVTTLAMVTGYGTDKVGEAWPADGPGAVLVQSIDYLNTGFGQFLLLIMAITSFTAAVAALNSCSRLFLAYARDGYLPAALNQTHPKFRTPNRSLLPIGMAIAFVSVAGLIWKGDDQAAALTVFSWLLLPAGVLLTVGIGSVAAVGAVVAYRRRLSIVRWLIEPAVALTVVLLGAASNFYPAPPPPYRWAPYAAIVWLAIGVILLVAFQRRGTVTQVSARTGTNVADEACLSVN